MTDSNKLPSDILVERLCLVQADVDDETPEVIGAVLERALEEGALDAVAIAVQMKKQRPGMRVEILCRPEDAPRFEALLLRETATLGVKRLEVRRTALARREERVEVLGEAIRAKAALWEGEPIRIKPEFDDCQRIARNTGRPLREIIDRARRAASVLLDTFRRG
ncbi:MAG: pyridinium-3,5-bisthiocarboxylic acid mononucleotide nickel chelatase [Candidatus Sumerlaeota bacterium]|nr:pyridinium-3,5-bisthiocarboxylic acid mononucleotide nickel chelatase [Candidatus Sumerlaeota bacterium]